MQPGFNLIPDDVDWKHYLVAPEIPKVIEAASLETELHDYLYGEGSDARGAQMPWSHFWGGFDLRPRELTLWSGINGHGKSLVLSQVMLHLMQQGQKVLICSFELPAKKTVARMLNQAATNHRPAPWWTSAWLAWTRSRLWLYAHEGRIDPAKLLAVCRWAQEKLGFDHIVIDGFTKLSIAPDDWGRQKEFINDAHSFAMTEGPHVHLVVHEKKREREGGQGNRFDVRGAGEIVDQADNLVMVRRNVDKELAMESGDEDKIRHWEGAPDAAIRVAKYRNFPWEHRVNLWFNKGALAFTTRSDGAVPGMHFERDTE